MTQWWQQNIEEITKSLSTDLSGGLTSQEAAARLGKYGPNQLEEKKGVSPWSIFLGQFEDFIIWVLIGAAIVSGFLQEWVDALAIIANASIHSCKKPDTIAATISTQMIKSLNWPKKILQGETPFFSCNWLGPYLVNLATVS